MARPLCSPLRAIHLSCHRQPRLRRR
jgi:hypothetical protein